MRHKKPLVPRHQQIMLVLVVLAQLFLALMIRFRLYDAEFRANAILIYSILTLFVVQGRMIDMNCTPVFLVWTAVGLVHLVVYLMFADIITSRTGQAAPTPTVGSLLMLPIWLPLYWVLNRLTVLVRRSCLVATGKLAIGDSEREGNWWDTLCNLILFFIPVFITIRYARRPF